MVDLREPSARTRGRRQPDDVDRRAADRIAEPNAGKVEAEHVDQRIEERAGHPGRVVATAAGRRPEDGHQLIDAVLKALEFVARSVHDGSDPRVDRVPSSTTPAVAAGHQVVDAGCEPARGPMLLLP